MCEIGPEVFGEATDWITKNGPIDLKKQIKPNIDGRELQNRISQKAPVAIGGIDTGWGGVLAPYLQADEAFLQSLTPLSSFDRILADGGFYRLPMRHRIAVASSSANHDEGSGDDITFSPHCACDFFKPAYRFIAIGGCI